MSPFIETFTGRDFWPLSPDPDAIDIRDIAHALSQQCRFSGHTRRTYSVAEHSVRVAELLKDWERPREEQLWGLLHDASEAYLVDIPSPLKCRPEFASYRDAEQALMIAICRRFHLPIAQPLWVYAADGVMLATEARDLMAYRPEHWAKLEYAALETAITPWCHDTAEHNFLARFKVLTEDK